MGPKGEETLSKTRLSWAHRAHAEFQPEFMRRCSLCCEYVMCCLFGPALSTVVSTQDICPLCLITLAGHFSWLCTSCQLWLG